MKFPSHTIEHEPARIDEAPLAAPAGGADSPRPVIRGESPLQDEGNHGNVPGTTALTDWLNCSFPFDPLSLSLEEFVKGLSEATHEAFGGMTDRNRGLHGFAQSFAFDRGGVLFAIGGQRNTAFLSIPGEGCAYVRDWAPVTTYLRDRLGARITRWDGAADDFYGHHSVDMAVELYRLGGFNVGGRPPAHSCHGDWIDPRGRGRTFEVGRRQSGKLLRIYEKGKQLGCPLNPWVRWELELRNVDRFIPWDVLSDPGRFLAGAYPCLSWISDQASRIRTVKAQDRISYDRLKEVGALAYGALINVMLQREGSPERVVELLRRDAVPRRLSFTDDYLRTQAGDDAL